MTLPLRKTLVTIALAAIVAAPPLAASAADWRATRTLDGPFAVSSPPDPPLVAMNANGHILAAWGDTGNVRIADKPPTAGWSPSRTIPGGNKGSGFIALALGDNEVAAVAFVTAATKYVPAKLEVSLRAPGGGFGTPVEIVPGAVAWDIRVGIACDGGVTVVWSEPAGVWATRLAGQAGAGACDGRPGPGPWAPAVALSAPVAGAALVDLATNAAGAALAVWQQGTGGNPTTVLAALQSSDGAWEAAQAVSTVSAPSTWNPKPGLDAAGNAAVGWLDGHAMVVARRPAGGSWGPPELLSGSQAVYYPALAMSAHGDLLAAWMTYDAGITGSIWQSSRPADGPWSAPARLSARGEDASWPSAAFAPDGDVAVVAWTDDNANTARAAVRSSAAWKRSALGAGWWGSVVPVAAGGGGAVAAWAQPVSGNPNAAQLLARPWR